MVYTDLYLIRRNPLGLLEGEHPTTKTILAYLKTALPVQPDSRAAQPIRCRTGLFSQLGLILGQLFTSRALRSNSLSFRSHFVLETHAVNYPAGARSPSVYVSGLFLALRSFRAIPLKGHRPRPPGSLSRVFKSPPTEVKLVGFGCELRKSSAKL